MIYTVFTNERGILPHDEPTYSDALAWAKDMWLEDYTIECTEGDVE